MNKSLLVLFFRKELLSFALCVVGVLALIGCSAAHVAFAGPKIVEVAGDGSLPVFDNAVVAMGARLGVSGSGDVQRLSGSALGRVRERAQWATLANVQAAIGGMKPAPGQGCLVFATSHGVQHEGLYLSVRAEVMTPQDLDRALLTGCGDAPTVVVISSCYSGAFVAAPMNRANRVILTAARADRTSFGCQAGRIYTVYDQCLLDAMGHAGTWRQVYGLVRGCVRAEEAREDVTPSEPLAWFGADVGEMALPAVK